MKVFIVSLLCLGLLAFGLWADSIFPGPIMRTLSVAGGGAANPGIESTLTTNTTDGSVAAMTLSFTTAGSDRLLFVGAGLGDSDLAGNAPISATYNGVALTQSWGTNSSDFVRSDGWYLVNPAVGANTLVVTYGGTLSDQRCLIICNVTNVHQTVPVDTAATASGVSAAPSVVVSSAVNDLVLSFVATDGEGTLTIATGTQVAKVQNVGTDTDYGMAQAAGSTAVTIAWTSGIEDWAIGGVSINPP